MGSALRGDAPFDSDVLAFYEAVFILSALATAVVVGLLRTSESASRLRARGLSRRTMQAESEVRRRVAESIHDGPVQELIGLDMILSAARNAAEHGRGDEAAGLIDEARELGMRNLRALRDEIVDLGPYAFQEISFETAIENCLPVWQRRYGFEVGLAIERIDMPPEMAGRPVPDRAGGGGERRPPRRGAARCRSRSGRSAHRWSCAWPTTGTASTERIRWRRRARAPRPREHARARGADGRHARDRVVGARDARARAGAARAGRAESD